MCYEMGSHFSLYLFGLPFAFVTGHISSDATLISFLAITLLSAYTIAKKAHREYFLHGFLVCVVGCGWMTLVHLILSRPYDPNPYWFIIVVIFGLVSGLLSVIASKIVRHRIA